MALVVLIGQLRALLLWIDDRRVTWLNAREVISVASWYQCLVTKMVWKCTTLSRFPSAMFGRGSFCKHASNKKKPLHERTARSSGTPTSSQKQSNHYFIKLHFVELLIHYSVRLCWYSLDTWKTFILATRLIPCLLHNYCYSAYSLMINCSLRQYSVFF